MASSCSQDEAADVARLLDSSDGDSLSCPVWFVSAAVTVAVAVAVAVINCNCNGKLNKLKRMRWQSPKPKMKTKPKPKPKLSFAQRSSLRALPLPPCSHSRGEARYHWNLSQLGTRPAPCCCAPVTVQIGISARYRTRYLFKLQVRHLSHQYTNLSVYVCECVFTYVSLSWIYHLLPWRICCESQRIPVG